MSKAKLSANNQIIVPEAIRDKLQLAPGDVLDFQENEHGEIVLKKATRMDAIFALLDQANLEAKQAGITEEELLLKLAKVRRERRHGDK